MAAHIKNTLLLKHSGLWCFHFTHLGIGYYPVLRPLRSRPFFGWSVLWIAQSVKHPRRFSACDLSGQLPQLIPRQNYCCTRQYQQRSMLAKHGQLQHGSSTRFHQRCLCRILGVTWCIQVTNEEILRQSESRKLQDIVVEPQMLVIFFAYQIINTQTPCCNGSCQRASGNKADPVKHGTKHSGRTCETLASDGKMSRMLLQIRLFGRSLPPYAPCAEGTDDDGVMNALLC